MKNVLKVGLTSLLLAPWGASQAVQLNEDFSLYLTASALSDYRLFGVSQTKENPAIQGQATLFHSSGLYAGGWISNVDFEDGDYGVPANEAGTEQRAYVGYLHTFNEDLKLNVGYIQYMYPGQSSANYSERYAVLDAYGAKWQSYYSTNVFEEEVFWYNSLGYTFALPQDISLFVNYGNADYKDPLFDNFSDDSYNDWEVKVSKTMLGIDWSLSYIDTNIDDEDCAGFWGKDSYCSATAVLGVSKTF
ncbi:hypothetical protein CK486_01520 [Pseudomonas sp. HAR-UPW-AIA-41]|uniref:TorF family putative porin n=1 Tax=Pseudomonas sp. HAR-UPW-AIA-41 TaxID=1985301 RepID=UPI000BB34107|nr:TorF family putative porin [Pseudomonas sp. HAR-UPW-AIA-41]PAV49477.1 hypothetical protein CK486_01520 [Pseudomonas sp. HAR-UPW-AIA-41]